MLLSSLLSSLYHSGRVGQRLAALLACVCLSIGVINAQSLVTSVTVGKPQSVGLVLSGGGAKGIAHIGVIQALEEHNIPIDYVAGTSMGAIVGGLYAAGYTPQEMMQLILSPGFTMWSTGQIDPNLTYYFMHTPQTPAFGHVSININPSDSLAATDIMPSSLISPLPMNFAFMDLFAAYTAQCRGNFNNLFVPFRCVTSDVVHKHKIVCRSGPLSDAIRASMSFPVVFQPIKMNGVEVYDGGIYDNFPVDVMREDFAPGIMIGVDVHSLNPPASNSIMSQLENMIIQNNDYYLPPEEGIHMHVDVSEFSLLDFGKAKEIYAKGYARAMEMMDSIEKRVTSRIPPETRRLERKVFKSKTPYVRFANVNTTGGSPAQNEYIDHLFKSSRTDTFGIDHARMAYYRALSPGKIRNLIPQAVYNDSTGLFDLDLTASLKNNFTLGGGAFLTSSVNSMIFASAEYAGMGFSSWTTRLMGWLGQSYMAGQFDWRWYLSNHSPSALELQAVVSRQRYYESDKLFYEDNSPAFISHFEGFTRFRYAVAAGRRGKAMVGIGGGKISDRFYSNDEANFAESSHEETAMTLGQLMTRFEYNTLNTNSYPVSGTSLYAVATQTLGRYTHNRNVPRGYNVTDSRPEHWFQAEFRGEHYITPCSHFSLGTLWDVLVSNRKLLNTYYASLVNAPAFAPTPAMEAMFNKAFHANSFLAAGLVPIWRPIQRGQVRLTTTAFLPFRRIEQQGIGTGVGYGRWFRNPEFATELDLVYNLPFASVVGYVNYLSYPASNWNLGISFGLYFTAAHFLR